MLSKQICDPTACIWESAPHLRHVAKDCDNNTQTIPNNMALWQSLAICRRARDLQSATMFNMNVNASQVPSPVPTVKVLYRSHVLTLFLDPVLGVMIKQVCWHSRRSEALTEGCPRHEDKARLTETRIYVILLLGPRCGSGTLRCLLDLQKYCYL